MARMTDFGVAVPQQFPMSGVADLGELRRGLEEADRAGLHSAWVTEGIIGPLPQLEPLTLVSYAAAVTSRLRLGLGVLLLPLRSPVQLAKALATLDQLSAGRLVVGVGVGGNHIDYAAFGGTRAERVRRFRAGLDVMRRLWTESSVDAEGPGFSLHRIDMKPKPIQKPLPVWIGAHAESALRRAVELGDGFLGAGSATTAAFARQVEFVRAELARTGRAPDSFPIGKRVYVAIDDDHRRASRLAADWFETLYGDRDRAAGAVAAGPIDACVEAIVEVIDAGAEMILLHPVADELRHIRRFVDELVPAVQEARPDR